MRKTKYIRCLLILETPKALVKGPIKMYASITVVNPVFSILTVHVTDPGSTWASLMVPRNNKNLLSAEPVVITEHYWV